MHPAGPSHRAADEDNEELEVKFAPLMEWLKETLSRFVDKVLLSSHLTRSPCTLLASQYGATGNMERIMRAQAYQQGLDTQVQAWETMRKVRRRVPRPPGGDGGRRMLTPCARLDPWDGAPGSSHPIPQKLEINAKHPIIQELLERVIAGKTGPDTVELAHVLYDTAALRAGYSLRDQELISFADRIDRIVRENLGVDLYAEVGGQAYRETLQYGGDLHMLRRSGAAWRARRRDRNRRLWWTNRWRKTRIPSRWTTTAPATITTSCRRTRPLL